MAKYLMLDRRLLNPQAMENVQLLVTPPVKDEVHNPLFTEEKPWEVRIDNGLSLIHISLARPMPGVWPRKCFTAPAGWQW